VRVHRRTEAESVPAVAYEEVRKLEIALEQLERAELYVSAAIEVDLADARRRRQLEDLYANLRATRRSLSRPHVADGI
jgi:hypothetical protein